TPDTDNPDPIKSHLTTLYFNAGKKEKLSKGDILGFLAKQCGLEASRIGKIVVKDHCALVAVDNDDVKRVTDTAKTSKVKGQRVRVTPVTPDV
ncbi:MAG: DbpA RNA binding domain-containing protein, partial [Muribaculaceae bacterium]|nr:DbpA RNA binding domain-containing protein [Muribaculaceae bacterium]